MVAPMGVAAGLVVALAGAVLARYARAVSNIQERLDAIGSNRRVEAVEAADWKVLLNRVIGGCLLAVGLLVALFALGA
ncbi:hypothetical protein [Halorubellus sp. PRR65]|uniref:hypothetical protein n=1 Tax=Halorubellus sp. PRR65 TaxID=3098148 RepID=UPI002B26218E|nr:hypothetical protein [Halorubellus sp. PRR65]